MKCNFVDIELCVEKDNFNLTNCSDIYIVLCIKVKKLRMYLRISLSYNWLVNILTLYLSYSNLLISPKIVSQALIFITIYSLNPIPTYLSPLESYHYSLISPRILFYLPNPKNCLKRISKIKFRAKQTDFGCAKI